MADPAAAAAGATDVSGGGKGTTGMTSAGGDPFAAAGVTPSGSLDTTGMFDPFTAMAAGGDPTGTVGAAQSVTGTPAGVTPSVAGPPELGGVQSGAQPTQAAQPQPAQPPPQAPAAGAPTEQQRQQGLQQLREGMQSWQLGGTPQVAGPTGETPTSQQPLSQVFPSEQRAQGLQQLAQQAGGQQQLPSWMDTARVQAPPTDTQLPGDTQAAGPAAGPDEGAAAAPDTGAQPTPPSAGQPPAAGGGGAGGGAAPYGGGAAPSAGGGPRMGGPPMGGAISPLAALIGALLRPGLGGIAGQVPMRYGYGIPGGRRFGRGAMGPWGGVRVPMGRGGAYYPPAPPGTGPGAMGGAIPGAAPGGAAVGAPGPSRGLGPPSGAPPSPATGTAPPPSSGAPPAPIRTAGGQSVAPIARNDIHIPPGSAAARNPPSMRPTQATVDRSRFRTEIERDPRLIGKMLWNVNGEIGRNAPNSAKIVQLETLFNRSQMREHSLAQGMLTVGEDRRRGYYALDTYSRDARPRSQQEIDDFVQNVLTPVMNGSNRSDIGYGPMTGNASDAPGNPVASRQFGRGTMGYKLRGGDTYFREPRPDGRLTKLPEMQQQQPTQEAAPTPFGPAGSYGNPLEAPQMYPGSVSEQPPTEARGGEAAA